MMRLEVKGLLTRRYRLRRAFLQGSVVE